MHRRITGCGRNNFLFKYSPSGVSIFRLSYQGESMTSRIIHSVVPAGVISCLVLLHVVFAADTQPAPANAPAAAIHIDKKLPPNMVRNPSVEAGRGNQPSKWNFGTGQPSNFEYGWVDGGQSGKKCLWVKSLAGRMSGYWSQALFLQPGKTYVFKGYYRIGGGRMLIWIRGDANKSNGQKVVLDTRHEVASSFGHWLTPVFLPNEVLSGPDPNVWQQFEVKVKVPQPVRAVRFHLGMYFAPGEAWFDDLWVGLDEADVTLKVTASPNESIERVVVKSGDKSGKTIFDSGPLAKLKKYEHALKARPLDETYLVEVHLTGGKIVSQRYPDNTAKKEQKS